MWHGGRGGSGEQGALAFAMHYDATFLSKHLIMDYSLLVGLDEDLDELVVGVIGE